MPWAAPPAASAMAHPPRLPCPPATRPPTHPPTHPPIHPRTLPCCWHQALLDEVMEEFFFGDGTAWEAAPPPAGLRPVVLDLLHALVTVQARGQPSGLGGGVAWRGGWRWRVLVPPAPCGGSAAL